MVLYLNLALDCKKGKRTNTIIPTKCLDGNLGWFGEFVVCLRQPLFPISEVYALQALLEFVLFRVVWGRT